MNCRAMGPILDAVAKEITGISIVKVNTEDAPKDVVLYEITSLPTLVFLNKGKMVGKIVGLKPKSLVIKKIQEVF